MSVLLQRLHQPCCPCIAHFLALHSMLSGCCSISRCSIQLLWMQMQPSENGQPVRRLSVVQVCVGVSTMSEVFDDSSRLMQQACTDAFERYQMILDMHTCGEYSFHSSIIHIIGITSMHAKLNVDLEAYQPQLFFKSNGPAVSEGSMQSFMFLFALRTYIYAHTPPSLGSSTAGGPLSPAQVSRSTCRNLSGCWSSACTGGLASSLRL